ncbi:hypothetical protein EC973_003168 [Apophysomyces ossiformis]|uniref:FAD/NAD(P)-binding domain-containing protein n=1 Tax=Apophysomyces ossiformis TaxID=679940 RepID=A0A8H7BRH0_9FUNG|nr:hypothetical protein EC973_003168 [Apophysomyces ossiformis]
MQGQARYSVSSGLEKVEDTSERTVKVAVIGSGLAGLTAAYLLTKGNTDSTAPTTRFETHLFEKGQALGMDASSISVGDKDKDFRIDLYKHLDIPAKPAKFSFGWYRIYSEKSTCDIPIDQIPSHTSNRSYLMYSGSRTVGRLGQPASSSETISEYLAAMANFYWQAIIVSISYTWLMILALWLHHRGHLRNPSHPVAQMSLGTWFQKYRIHPYFVHHVFVPLFAAVCTNSWQSMLEYPAADVLEYMAVGLFQESYVVSCGVRQVVKKLAAPLNHIHLGTAIVSIRPTQDNASYAHRFILFDEQGKKFEADHIIFATQGNQALRMLQECYDHVDTSQFHHQQLRQDLERQINMLKAFKYDTSVVINHTDTRLLPSNPQDWQILNLAAVDASVQPGKCRLIVPYPHDTTMTTHILNLTHKTDDQCLYLQTTNPCIAPDPKHVISVSWFERATVTVESRKMIHEYLFVPLKNGAGKTKLGPCQGSSGIWFVGSYCWKGIPLLEGCVASAEKVVVEGIAATERVKLKIPWLEDAELLV